MVEGFGVPGAEVLYGVAIAVTVLVFSLSCVVVKPRCATFDRLASVSLIINNII